MPASALTPLERPTLTVTGAVGLLLGSIAWAVTDAFVAAPLVFIASLVTSLALATVLQGALDEAERRIETLTDELRVTQNRSPEAGGAEAVRDCELNDVLTRAVNAVRPEADRSGVLLRWSACELYLAVAAVPAELERTLADLLRHAVAGAGDGGEVRASARLERTDAVAEIAGGRADEPSPVVARSLARSGGRLSSRPTPDGGALHTVFLPYGHRGGPAATSETHHKPHRARTVVATASPVPA
jgi:hypothetical protein